MDTVIYPCTEDSHIPIVNHYLSSMDDINYDDLLITDQNFYLILPNYGRFHFNLYWELIYFCLHNNLREEDQEIRLGYDSSLSLNMFLFYDIQNYISAPLINEVEQNQHRLEIESIFDE